MICMLLNYICQIVISWFLKIQLLNQRLNFFTAKSVHISTNLQAGQNVKGARSGLVKKKAVNFYKLTK